MKTRKRCPRCKKELLISKFNKNLFNKDGHQNECRECANARGRRTTKEKNEAKKIKKETDSLRARTKIAKQAKEQTKKRVKKQFQKDKISDLEFRAKDLFLHRIADYMVDQDINYAQLAERAGYSKTTVGSYLNGPEKVSEQFIRQVSKKIPALSRSWNTYRELVYGKEIGVRPLVPALSNDQYIIMVDKEIVEADNGSQNEAQISEALNDYMIENQITPGECVIEIFKLIKMGYELNVTHELTIYSSAEPQVVKGIEL